MPLKKCIIEMHNSSIEILDTYVSGSLVNRLKQMNSGKSVWKDKPDSKDCIIL